MNLLSFHITDFVMNTTSPFYSLLGALTMTLLLTSCTSEQTPSLHQQVQAVIDTVNGRVAVAYINLQDPSDTLFINADELFHAASTMKTPVLVEAYKQAQAGGISIHDSIMVHNNFTSIVDGSPFSVERDRDSGKQMHELIGQRVPIREILYDMTINSGNLSTNIIIDRLGAHNVTQTMRELGAEDIHVLRGVEDMKAFEAGQSNMTSARSLALLYEHLAKGTAVSKTASDDMIQILFDQRFREMIPAGLPYNIRVAHKTGWITGVVHDSGIIFLPDGRMYVLVILNKDLDRNEQGTEAGALISSIIYEWIK
jgi:beta-lactamase class A